MEQRPVSLDRIEPADWEAVHSWASQAAVCRFQLWGPNTEEQTREFVAAAVEAWSHVPQKRFAYVARAGEDVVGMGELHVRSFEQRRGEIAYVVHPRAWGQGVGTAIGRRLLSHGFERLGLHRIFATCDPRNLASARVLAKLGMTWEGRHRHVALIRDGWRDSEVFGILEDEWRAGTRPPAPRVAAGGRRTAP
ncbi:GNAT family N-acetyltransferase [Actinoallomurus rhizosphaericola]|uniref:GNAT family N-acetyltransferase n=1 Tax=Actinoallomurus rhizosphaericola TaxID=2952536 RepID=UPI0020918CE0|nr:GNAT family protein [Actinoallomurus rhizosphaericola]MCO5993261.1 GNAT family N-acetyltransferase [Actinoallomurus rhizosphaericola]